MFVLSCLALISCHDYDFFLISWDVVLFSFTYAFFSFLVLEFGNFTFTTKFVFFFVLWGGSGYIHLYFFIIGICFSFFHLCLYAFTCLQLCFVLSVQVPVAAVWARVCAVSFLKYRKFPFFPPRFGYILYIYGFDDVFWTFAVLILRFKKLFLWFWFICFGELIIQVIILIFSSSIVCMTMGQVHV